MSMRESFQFEDPNLLKPPKRESMFDWSRLVHRYGPIPFQGPMPEWRELPQLAFHQFKSNILSSLSLCLVSLPLSIALAVAAGASPNAGLISAAWAGLFHSLFGGSEYNIVGPTGALSGILMMYSIRYGPEVLPFLALITAVLLLFVWLLRLDTYLLFIPSCVIEGFTVGVGAIIGLGQLPNALGLTGLTPQEGLIGNLVQVGSHISETNIFAFMIAAVCTGLLLVLIHFWPKVPWGIIIASFGILFGYLINTDLIPMGSYKLLCLKDKFGVLETDLFSVVLIKHEWLEWETLKELFFAALNIAVVVILETLISAKIGNKVTNTQFVKSWETLGICIANFACAFFGGIPSTAALARTMLNIQNGATSRVSGIMHAIFVIIVSYLVLPLFQYLLMPVVAAIVLVVAIRMVDWQPLKHMYELDKGSFGTAIFTLIVCLLDNPTNGILVGAVVSLLRMASYVAGLKHETTVSLDNHQLFIPVRSEDWVASDEEVNESDNSYRAGDILIFAIPGDLTFLNAMSYVERAKQIHNKYKSVVLSLYYLGYIDADGIDALTEIVHCLNKTDLDHLVVCGLREELHHFKILRKCEWFRDLEEKGRIFKNRDEAVSFLQNQLSEEVSSFSVSTSEPEADEDGQIQLLDKRILGPHPHSVQ